MKLQKKKNSLSREQAMELYDDLEKAMGSLLGPKAAKKAAPAGASPARARAAYQRPADDMTTLEHISSPEPSFSQRSNASYSTVTFLVMIALLKIASSCIEASGIFAAPPAHAVLAVPSQPETRPTLVQNSSGDERKILLALDERRASLEERSRKLDKLQRDLDRRDQEATTRLTELREMTTALKLDRDKSDKKRNTQIEQLANVYGSMDPKEAASLIEQLDITIALNLLQKMPEKRIAQILALMNPERALGITRMLSGAAKADGVATDSR